MALREIEAKDEEREALRRAEEEHALRGDVESWCAVAVAYLGARHTVRAELVAREVCERHPESGLAWGTRATLLFELGRFRDAVEPARTSLALGADEAGGRALLARILARIGPEGREESAELAAAEIEGAESPRLLSSELLADLAVIMHYAGTDIRHARRADDLVWERRSVEEPPPEWLGAAAARRGHGVWAEDAPEWLARLAGAAPQELARFVVERIEAVLYWHAITEPSPQGGTDPAGDEGFAGGMDEAAKELAHRTACEEAVNAALRAAFELGYAEPDLDDGHERSGTTIVSARAWEPHAAEIASCFGDELAIQLRASELAQPVLFGSEEAGAKEYLVVRETLAGERLAWIQWGGTNKVFPNLDAISELSPATRVRLETVLDLAQTEDDEAFRRGSG